MKLRGLLKRLEGVQTIDSVMNILGVDRQKAIYYVHRLRKAGFVKTSYTGTKKRVYRISHENMLGGRGYYDIINEYSPMKLAVSETHRIYGRDVSLEETLVFAIESGRIRVILASLSLFGKISDWKLLYSISKEKGAERKAGALYDLSRKLKIRVRRMDGRIRRLMLPSESDGFQYIIPGIKTKEEEYKEIEKSWKVYLPFNRSDLEAYL